MPAAPSVAKPCVFIDANVLIAGSASTTGASFILLQLCELTIIEGIISEQVRVETERNLREKLPQALPAYRVLIESALKQLKDPQWEDLERFHGQADAKDLPILAAAVLNDCDYLITFNVKDYHPDPKSIVVRRPGEFLQQLRRQLQSLVHSKRGPDEGDY